MMMMMVVTVDCRGRVSTLVAREWSVVGKVVMMLGRRSAHLLISIPKNVKGAQDESAYGLDFFLPCK